MAKSVFEDGNFGQKYIFAAIMSIFSPPEAIQLVEYYQNIPGTHLDNFWNSNHLDEVSGGEYRGIPHTSID